MSNTFKTTIFALIAAAFTLSSCSEDEEFNSTDATVGLEKSSISVKENKGLFYVPLTVTGERNGTIQVNVEVETIGDDCEENTHFLVTSKRINIPKGKNTANIEIKSVDNRKINIDRTFVVKLVSVRGGKPDSQKAATTVTLLDNDDIPYERMAGKWKVTAYQTPDYAEEASLTWTTELTTIEEGESGYGRVINMSPWVEDSYTFLTHPMKFTYDAQSETATISLAMGSTMTEGMNFGVDDLGHDFTSGSVYSATLGMNGNIKEDGSIVATVSSDFTTITLTSPIFGMIRNDKGEISQVIEGNNVYFSPMFMFYKMVFTLTE